MDFALHFYRDTSHPDCSWPLTVSNHGYKRSGENHYPPQRYTVHEEIHAKVENMGHNAVTFCVEFGQTSMKGDEVESTAIAFLGAAK